MSTFHKACWIWENPGCGEDEFAQFTDTFEWKRGRTLLRLSCDSDYTLWVNGALAGFSKYSDYPGHRFYEELDVTPYLSAGNNRLAITVWYYGVDSSTYIRGESGLIYEAVCGGRVLAASGEATLCRIADDYVSRRRQLITCQLGLGYACRVDGEAWKTQGFDGHPAVRKELPLPGEVRPILPLELGARAPGYVCFQGVFRSGEEALASERMQRAGLYYRELSLLGGDFQGFSQGPLELSSNEGDGLFVVLDLGREISGFLDLELEADSACRVDVGYGEHLDNGRVNSRIGERNFCLELEFAPGKQSFLGTFRRLGARYLQLMIHAPRVKLRFAGLRPVEYPVRRKPFPLRDRLLKRIYEVSADTLRLCMHSHYEDTPWREQALYAMDSRNQMLFGYTAFGEYRFARAGLKLLSESRLESGLLALCAPSGVGSPIPCFSLIYPVQVAEYVEASGDVGLGLEVLGTICRILDAFAGRIDDTGLIPASSLREYWNFYEWTEGMDGFGEESASEGWDAPLAGFYGLSCLSAASLCRRLEKNELAEEFSSRAKAVAAAFEAFYAPEEGLYRTYLGKCPEHFSELANSLAVLCGAAGERSEEICRRLADPGNGMVKISLSYSLFRIQALLDTDFAAYWRQLTDETAARYGRMLYAGATSFWETDDGSEDFDGAGSLCHGWSAVPIYLFDALRKKGIRL